MVKILYGVAGQGSGHSSRAREIINYLEKNGHTVKVVSYDKGVKNLKDDFDVEEIFGLSFSYKNNETQYLSTFLKNFLKTPEAIKSIERVSKIVDEFKPQIVFSDFEPISGLVANAKKIPLISIDNQHYLTNTKIVFPKKYEQEAFTGKAVTKLIFLNVNAYLVICFAKAELTDKKTFLFPPILSEEVLKTETKEDNYILVYLTSPFQELVDILKKIDKKFVIYGFEQNKKEGNLVFKKPSQKGFLKDLANCEGVIANAGFSLMSESLYLRKPYLALPVAAQIEQIANAIQLEQFGYGKYWDELNKERIESFLYNLNLYKKNLKKYKKEDNSKIFKKIDELIKEYTK